MASVTAFCTSAKLELLKAVHNFSGAGGNSFKIALYTSAATHGAGTTSYSATNEISGTGYTATGAALTNVEPATSGTTAFTDFEDVTWANADFTAASALIYNDTAAGDPSVSVHDFSGDKTASGGDFTVQFPTPDASNAILRLA